MMTIYGGGLELYRVYSIDTADNCTGLSWWCSQYCNFYFLLLLLLLVRIHIIAPFVVKLLLLFVVIIPFLYLTFASFVVEMYCGEEMQEQDQMIKSKTSFSAMNTWAGVYEQFWVGGTCNRRTMQENSFLPTIFWYNEINCLWCVPCSAERSIT